jgi:hypothetical protein
MRAARGAGPATDANIEGCFDEEGRLFATLQDSRFIDARGHDVAVALAPCDTGPRR